MSDALAPLRHVYDVEPTGPAPGPGDAGYAEHQALREVRAALDALPREAPSPDMIAAVETRAAEVLVGLAAVRAVYEGPAADPLVPVEAETIRQSRGILDASLRPERPRANVVAAVKARAAEASGIQADPFEAASPVEAVLLDQSLQALDRLPVARPDMAVIAAVEAFAASAAAALAAVRHVYADGPEVAGVEAVVLRQSRQVVERALARRPQPRPSAEAVAAVLARAAEVSGVEADLFEATSSVEAALFDQSVQALDRLPRPRPEAATLDAVRLAALTASAPAVAERPARPASVDRAAITQAAARSRRAPVGAWLGGAALVLAALVAVVVLPFGGAAEEMPIVAAAVQQDLASAPAPRASREAVDEAPAPAPLVSSGSSLAASAAVSGFVPVAEVTRAAPRPSAPAPVAAALSVPVAAASRAADRPADRPANPTKTPAWEASDDVRALSLRLQQLDATDALAWDEPAEAFGAPATATLGATPGVQSVRAGAAPARARLRTDSSSVQR